MPQILVKSAQSLFHLFQKRVLLLPAIRVSESKNGVCTMKKPRLDHIDLKILRILQTNGRVTNVELARQAGISAPPCLRRVRALEKAGFITCLLYTSPSPRDGLLSRMPSSA